MNSIQNSMFIQYQKNSLTPDTSVHNLFQPTDTHKTKIMENKYQIQNINKDKSLVDIWKDKFNRKNNIHELSLNLKTTTMTWTNQNNNVQEKMEENEVPSKEKKSPSPTPSTPDKEPVTSPAHHARRPMNAFLIFCKKHRPIVRKKYPTLENRGVTRILGEWWAMLDVADKEAYTKLAKEYKDAFFTANPNFKWYKLPAPPLRPGAPRPLSVQKEVLTSPTSTETTPHEAEFTPGKLADESQLGSLTSLLNSSSYCPYKTHEAETRTSSNTEINRIEQNNNNNTEVKSVNVEPVQLTPENVAQNVSLPPKPIKKRIFDHNLDNKNVARNIFETSEATANISDNTLLVSKEVGPNVEDAVVPVSSQNEENADNMTNQDLVERVVESIYAKQKSKSVAGKQKLKETRTSGRSCKGKRYAEFMRNGKLLKNKRDKRSEYNFQNVDTKFDYELNNKIDNSSSNKTEIQTPKLALENTIKRLAERTNIKLEAETNDTHNNEYYPREKTTSECSDDLNMQGSMFNLELRIAQLPSLSYDTYLQRKRESKKRKQMRKPNASPAKIPKVEDTPIVANNNKVLIGSKKRKNKMNITHLQKTDKPPFISSSFAAATTTNDLSGLATLAEIAANTEKIN